MNKVISDTLAVVCATFGVSMLVLSGVSKNDMAAIAFPIGIAGGITMLMASLMFIGMDRSEEVYRIGRAMLMLAAAVFLFLMIQDIIIPDIRTKF